MKNSRTFLLINSVFLLVTTMMWWGLAFFPVSQKSYPLLEQARLVCFGSAGNGLPEGYGWMLLIGAPLMLGVFIWIVWGSEWAECKALIKRNHWVCFSLLLLALLAVAESFWVVSAIAKAVGKNGDQSQSAVVDLQAYTRMHQDPPSFHLVDETGHPNSWTEAKGKVVYVTFAFAHCQTFCPTLAATIKKTHENLGDQKSTAYIISLDPWRDTPESLPHMHEQWNLPSTMHVMSGSVEEVNRVLDAFNVPRSRDVQTGEVTHPALVYVIGPDGKVAYIFNAAPAELLIQAGRELLK